MGREDHKREILNEIVTHSSNQTTPDLKHVITNYEQVLSNKIKKYFPGRLERGPLDKRCDKIKEWMRQNLIDNPLDEEKKEKYGVDFATFLNTFSQDIVSFIIAKSTDSLFQLSLRLGSVWGPFCSIF